MELSIPFSEFQDKKGDRPAPTAEQLKSVSQFWVYMNKTEDYTGPGSIGLDNIRAMSESTPPGPSMIDVPTAPVWTDECGPSNNGFFSGYRDTDRYAWKVIDRSTRTGKVRITVRAKKGYAFRGVQRTLWTKKQDNSRCAATISAATTPQTCSESNQPVPGSLTLDKTDIGRVYVYKGAKTGAKAGDLSALDPGKYLIIATAEKGSAFNEVPAGWKPSPSTDADGHVVKVSMVAIVGGTDCG